MALKFTELLNDNNEWGPFFTLWSNSEGKLSPALAATAKAVEKNFLALQELVGVEPLCQTPNPTVVDTLLVWLDVVKLY